MRPLRRYLAVLVCLVLCCCSGNKPDSSWVKSWHDESVVFALNVCGKEGNPYVAILTRHKPGSENTPRFRWQLTTGDVSTDVLLDGKPLPYSGKLVIVVNGHHGLAKTIALPAERTSEFSQREIDHWDKRYFQKFWDEVVEPQLESK